MITIVTAADDRFAMPMAVTLYSALANLEKTRTVSVYIVDGGLSLASRQRLEAVLTSVQVNVRIQWVTPDLLPLSGVKTTTAFSQAAYLRLLIPELIPDDVDRAIYLDSDLVVERDLSELWDLDLDNRPALAVQDYMYPFVSSLHWVGDTYQSRGLSPDTPYCNSGVLLMNLKRWRADGIAEQALHYMRESPQLIRWADQDGINAVLAGSFGLLDDRWNVMLSAINSYRPLSTPSTMDVRHARHDLLKQAFILHFTGSVKPWRFAYRGRSQFRFFHYLRESDWYGHFSDLNGLMEYTWKLYAEPDHWMKMLAESVQELAQIVPEGDSVILVDESNWPGGVLEGRHVIPFPEENGHYAGIPRDNSTAIHEFERLRESGAGFIVFADPALWWLSYFSEFNSYLRRLFRCVRETDHFVAFDLRQ